jgi:cell division protein FtsZ
VLHQATKGISDLINVPGLINLDFADVKTVMENMGDAIMGTGIAHGEERAILAAQQAINSPLLQSANINGAKGLLVNITGPEEMTIHELNDASSIIYEEAGEEANVILGCVIDKSLTDEVRVTVIATGLNEVDTQIDTSFNNAYNKSMNADTPPRFIAESTQIKNNDGSSSFVQPSNVSDDDRTEINENRTFVKNNASKAEDPIMTFGEDLDVPAFIRNRRS